MSETPLKTFQEKNTQMLEWMKSRILQNLQRSISDKSQIIQKRKKGRKGWRGGGRGGGRQGGEELWPILIDFDTLLF